MLGNYREKSLVELIDGIISQEGIMRVYRWILLGCLVSAMSTAMGCNKSVTAPSGTTMTINPASKTWDITPTSCPSTSYNDELVTITVKDANGEPMNNISINVALDLSPNTGSVPVQVLELYDGNTLVTSPYATTTGDFGTKTLKVRMDFGCTYKAVLSVFSGTAYATAKFETS